MTEFTGNQIVDARKRFEYIWNPRFDRGYATKCDDDCFLKLLQIKDWATVCVKKREEGTVYYSWVLPDRAAKILEILNSDHWQTLFKAWEIANEESHTGGFFKCVEPVFD
jgi:hypothetical protein